ncbi:hypothetical protein AHiyo4_11080 [Arthrobacter sp. Hiyo4]|nr:hypothetical protein AHiyo4_11080 [Arthrobacter sp. Hiyo4]
MRPRLDIDHFAVNMAGYGVPRTKLMVVPVYGPAGMPAASTAAEGSATCVAVLSRVFAAAGAPR